MLPEVNPKRPNPAMQEPNMTDLKDHIPEGDAEFQKRPANKFQPINALIAMRERLSKIASPQQFANQGILKTFGNNPLTQAIGSMLGGMSEDGDETKKQKEKSDKPEKSQPEKRPTKNQKPSGSPDLCQCLDKSKLLNELLKATLRIDKSTYMLAKKTVDKKYGSDADMLKDIRSGQKDAETAKSHFDNIQKKQDAVLEKQTEGVEDIEEKETEEDKPEKKKKKKKHHGAFDQFHSRMNDISQTATSSVAQGFFNTFGFNPVTQGVHHLVGAASEGLSHMLKKPEEHDEEHPKDGGKEEVKKSNGILNRILKAAIETNKSLKDFLKCSCAAKEEKASDEGLTDSIEGKLKGEAGNAVESEDIKENAQEEPPEKNDKGGSGILSNILGAGGAIGLGKSILGGAGSLLKKGAGAAADVAGGAASGIAKFGKLAGGVAKKALRFAGPIGLALAAGDVAYNAFESGGDAKDVLHLNREATTGEKIMAGIGGAAESISMGLVSREKVANGLHGIFGDNDSNATMLAQNKDAVTEKKPDQVAAGATNVTNNNVKSSTFMPVRRVPRNGEPTVNRYLDKGYTWA